VHPRKTVEVRDKLARFRIEGDELIRVHVSDVEAAARRVETLVIESNRGPRHRDVRNDPQRSG
jgi:hypothetical protein